MADTEQLTFEIEDACNDQLRHQGLVTAPVGVPAEVVGGRIVQSAMEKIVRVAPGTMEVVFLRLRLGGACVRAHVRILHDAEGGPCIVCGEEECPRFRFGASSLLFAGLMLSADPKARSRAWARVPVAQVRLITEADRELALQMLHGAPPSMEGALVLLGFAVPAGVAS